MTDNHFAPYMIAPSEIPTSIAISGIYGYMGSLLYKAALELGINKIYGYDPGRPSEKFEISQTLELLNEDDFYHLDADLFHICSPPDARHRVLELIKRNKKINIEKPIVHPAMPQLAYQLKKEINNNQSSVLFDFIEVFNPRTYQYLYLLEQKKQYSDFKIQNIFCTRSKDREDKDNIRNKKVIVPIQYQETCHCLAFILLLLNKGTNFTSVFPEGLISSGHSLLYTPPNPEDYMYGAVDGKMCAKLNSDIHMHFLTDFKKKRRYPL